MRACALLFGSACGRAPVFSQFLHQFHKAQSPHCKYPQRQLPKSNSIISASFDTVSSLSGEGITFSETGFIRMRGPPCPDAAHIVDVADEPEKQGRRRGRGHESGIPDQGPAPLQFGIRGLSQTCAVQRLQGLGLAPDDCGANGKLRISAFTGTKAIHSQWWFRRQCQFTNPPKIVVKFVGFTDTLHVSS